MFGDKNEAEKIDYVAAASGQVSTVLDKECSFEGKMTFEGIVFINGKFKGEIFSDGQLIIGESGYVEGVIEIGTIEIQGEVRGNILAKQRIEINSPAVVQGDIAAPSLIKRRSRIRRQLHHGTHQS